MHDVVVVGAGIVGLATAWRLVQARPGLRITVVDKEPRVGVHQSGRNSGVLHAGVYYPPGSDKARLCRRGKRQLEAFCDEHGVDYALNGKLVVAADESELGRLESLEARARANGVPGLRRLGPRGMRAVEPHVRGVAALHSPRTGVVDFAAVCRALADRLEAAGVELRLTTPVAGVDGRTDHATVTTPAGTLGAGAVVVCAGLQSDRLAGGDGARIIPFRGSWIRVRAHARHLVAGNVYPVPDPRLPFLGVHLTRRIDGELMIGPNALLAAAREGYDRPAVDARDLLDTLSWPGLWRLAARHWRTGLRELLEDRLTGLYLRRVRRYLPALSRADVVAGPAGIRAQSVTRGGELVDDFSVERRGRVLHVRNAPSPAATASLAIGQELAGRVLGGRPGRPSGSRL